MKRITSALSFFACLAAATVAAEPVVRTANNGNLVMEDIPEIPASIVASLNRYQNVRCLRAAIDLRKAE